MLSTSTKLKNLSKKYGKTALAVYLGISTIDMALCYAMVSLGGNQVVGSLEKWVEEKTGLKMGMKKEGLEGKKPGFVATLTVAYAVHKLLAVVRVPLTVAFTPMTARWLARRGWLLPKLPPTTPAA